MLDSETNTTDAGFRLLLEQVQSGSQQATRQLIEHYAPTIVRAVRRRLNKAIRAKFDSADFVQAVWASFFATAQQLLRFNRPEELVGYLTAMAQNKVIDENRRRLQTDKHNVNRERSLNDSSEQTEVSLAGSQPSPSQLAIANELWDRLVNGLPVSYQRVLELRRFGNTHRQIAQQLGMNERTVRRVLRKILERRCHERRGSPPRDEERGHPGDTRGGQ